MNGSEEKSYDIVPGLQIGKSFDAETARECFGNSEVSVISPYETLHSFKNVGFIVWTEGPKTGEIYRIVKHTEKESFENSSFIEEIECTVKEMLIQAAELQRKFNTFIPKEDAGGQRYEVAREKRKIIAEILYFLYKVYYDPQNNKGIEAVVLTGSGDTKKNCQGWIEKINEKGAKGYLKELAKELSLDVYLDGSEDNEQRLMINRFFYDMDDTYDNNYVSEDPILLTHATWSHSLTNVIQMGGLAAKNYFESKGIKKRFGGEGGWIGSYTPDDVSFRIAEKDQAHIAGGWGPKRGFDYPMVYAVSKSKAVELVNSGINLQAGTMQTEKTVRDFVDLKYISHIFVPNFKIEEVNEILRAHGHGHIQVLPLGQNVP